MMESFYPANDKINKNKMLLTCIVSTIENRVLAQSVPKKGSIEDGGNVNYDDDDNNSPTNAKV
jgi:hypothetical protein